MIVGLVVAVLGVGAIALGAWQLSGATPMARLRHGAFSAVTNIVVGVFLIALGALRLKGLL